MARAKEVRRGAVMQYVKSGEEQLPWGGAIEQAEATESRPGHNEKGATGLARASRRISDSVIPIGPGYEHTGG